MAVLPILRWPDPRLAEVCAPVPEGAEMGHLIADMFDTLYAAPGRGLAGPQVGAMLRIFITDTDWKDGTPAPMVFINPEITDHAGETVTRDEGCLSIPGVLVGVARPEWVEMAWTDETGAARTGRFEGFATACVQHELDHLNGMVTLDRVSPEARDRAEAAYAEVPQ